MKRFFPFLTALLLVGCSQEPADELFVMDLNPSKLVPKEAFLDDLFEEVSYIPLETTEDNLISFIRKAIITDKHILVSAGNQIMLFDTSGRFLRNIGQQGRGPGEYQFVNTFVLDEELGEIQVPDGRKVIRYSLQGEYLGDYKTTGKESTYLLYEDYLYSERTRARYPVGEDVYSIFKYNRQFNLLDSMPTLLPRSFSDGRPRIIMTSPNLQLGLEGLLFREPYGDTVYTIHADLSVTPRMVLETNNLRYTEELMYNPEKYENESSERIRIVSYTLTSKGYALVNFQYQKSWYQAYSFAESPEVWKAVVTNSEGEESSSFQLRGFPGQKAYIMAANACHFATIPAYQAAAALQKTADMDEETYQKIKGLREEDNPVLVVLK